MHSIAKMQLSRPAPINQQALRALSFKRKGKKPATIRLSRIKFVACPMCAHKFLEHRLSRHYQKAHGSEYPTLLLPLTAPEISTQSKFVICPICDVWFKGKDFKKHVRLKHPESMRESWMKPF